MHKKQQAIARMRRLRRERKLARLKAEEAAEKKQRNEAVSRDMLMKIHKILMRR